jgi:peptidoglycan/LPS O-acetylase OafA/YrhL
MKTDQTIKSEGVRKYLGLQILRITAACMVLFEHSGFYVSERLDTHFAYWKQGASGVVIFFVLSGFVMIYSSAKLMNDANGWKIFAERRVVRIVPIYWIATSIKVIALLLSTGYILHTQFSVVKAIESYLFLPAFNAEGHITPVLAVGWTLNFEMFFYFLFTLALFLRVSVYKFVGGVLAVLSLGAIFRQDNWPAVSVYLNPIVLEFFYGMVIAKICLSGKHIPKYFALPLLALGFFGLLASWPLSMQVLHLLQGISAALIVYSMASIEDSLTRIPRFVLYLADASYAIYLYHEFIGPVVPIVLMKLHLVYPWLSIAVSVILSLGAGCLIHLLIEAPITKWFRNHLLIGGKKVIHPVATV